MDALVDAQSATTGVTTEEEDEVEDAGTIAAPARSGATGLVRTAGRTSLARVPGGTRRVKIAPRATPVFPRCRRHQEGMTTTIKTRGWGLPGAAHDRLHLGQRTGPSLAAYLQAVCS